MTIIIPAPRSAAEDQIAGVRLTELSDGTVRIAPTGAPEIVIGVAAAARLAARLRRFAGGVARPAKVRLGERVALPVGPGGVWTTPSEVYGCRVVPAQVTIDTHGRPLPLDAVAAGQLADLLDGAAVAARRSDARPRTVVA